MRILEVILEGFKSYPHRTVFRNFDKSFNAVTGLNGSGKSNFLDAIIFVLGISKNFQMLRIQKLNELVYKNAMGNITKAEVTVIFDNSDSSNQPIGYEDCVTITVSRIIEGDKNKFYINGKQAKVKDYKDMLKQVKLSIESPSFIVTQGKIAKIITLKPKELLEMIEDTVGTLLFKQKKAEILKGIDKEIGDFIEQATKIMNKVGPQLKKIRHDMEVREQINGFKGKLELVQQKVLAAGVDYHKSKIKEVEFQQERFQKKLQQSHEHEKFLDEKLQECDEKIARRRELEAEQKQFLEIQRRTVLDQQEVQKLKGKLQTTQNDLQKQDQLYKVRQDQKIELMKEIESIQTRTPQIDLSIIDIEDSINSKRQDQERIQFSSDYDQRQVVGDNITSTTFELNQLTNKLKSIQDQLYRQKEKIKSQGVLKQYSLEDITKLKQKVDQLEPKRQQLLAQVGPLNEVEGKIRTLTRNLESNKNDLNALLREKDSPEFSLINISNEARRVLPENFDRNCFDTLASRCRFNQRYFDQYKQVINESMIGSLGTVICDNVEQANVLCKYSFQLFNHRSVTIQTRQEFNNSYVVSRQEQEAIVNRARGLGQRLLFLWELLEIDPQYKKFFDRQFQTQVVIDDLKKGGEILAREFQLRVFNLEGDYVQDGIISGGYKGENQQRTRNADLIQKYHFILDKIKNLRETIKNQQQDLESLQKTQAQLKQYDIQLQEVVKTIDKTNAEIQRKEQSLQEYNINSLMQEIQQLEEDEVLYQKKLKDCENSLKEYTDQLKLCKGGQKVDKDYIAQQLKKIEFEIVDLKKQLLKQQKLKDDLEEQRRVKSGQLTDVDEELVKLEKDKKDLGESVNNQQRVLKEKQRLLDDRMSENEIFQEQHQILDDMTIEKLTEQVNQIKADIVNLQSERPAITEEIKKCSEQILAYKNQIKQIKLHPFYVKVMQEINDGKYQINIKETVEQYEQLREQQTSFETEIQLLSSTLNFKTITQKQIELTEVFDNVGGDIEKLFKSSNDLKRELEDCEVLRETSVRRCVAQVSEDFSMIFHTLYPSAEAELRGIGEKFTENGLEVIIRMEGREKPLSQLSGGQKSLLAVALLMAQLRYFPSPFYLLDEIDSALDVEHTEKLGLIFATHFKTAQFILISLKVQMFRSAPVIFNVSQQGGVSSISREEGKVDEKTLQRQLRGYNINMEEHQQIEEKRVQQDENYRKQKQRKLQLKKDQEEFDNEQSKEEQVDDGSHWIAFSKTKKFRDANQKFEKIGVNTNKAMIPKNNEVKAIEDFRRLEAEYLVRLRFQNENDFHNLSRSELDNHVNRIIGMTFLDKGQQVENNIQETIDQQKAIIEKGKKALSNLEKLEVEEIPNNEKLSKNQLKFLYGLRKTDTSAPEEPQGQEQVQVPKVQSRQVSQKNSKRSQKSSNE